MKALNFLMFAVLGSPMLMAKSCPGGDPPDYKPDDTGDTEETDADTDSDADSDSDTDSDADTDVPCDEQARTWVDDWLATCDTLALADPDADGLVAWQDCDSTDSDVGGIMLQDETGIYVGTDYASVDAALAEIEDGGTVTVCGWQDVGYDGVNVNMAGELNGMEITIQGQPATDGCKTTLLGSSSSGIEVYGEVTLWLKDIAFYNNTAVDVTNPTKTDARGGGIRAGERSILVVENVIVAENHAYGHGGGVYLNDSQIASNSDIYDIVLYGNTVSSSGDDGAGMYVTDESYFLLGGSNGGTYIVDNGDSAGGSGLFVKDDTTPVNTMMGCIAGNEAYDVNAATNFDVGGMTSLECIGDVCTAY